MIDLYRNLFHGPGLHLESGFRFRFVALSSFAVAGLCLFTSRLILSGPHTCPCPCPYPPTSWAFPTPPHHERFIHLGITSISLQPPPPPHAPLLTPTTTLPAFLHFATPITSAKPVPKDSSRAAVTYFTFSFSFSFLSYIYNFARESCIYCTYMLARIFFVVYLVLIRGFRIVHSGPLTWCL